MQLQSLARVVCGAGLSMLVMFAATAVSAQTWEYKSYKKGGYGGQYDRNKYVMGTVSLEEKDGKATLMMNAGQVDACRRGEMPAQVTRSDTEITVEPQVDLAGCEKWRLVIRADGSGGRREVWRGDAWKDTGWDHGLTPRK